MTPNPVPSIPSREAVEAYLDRRIELLESFAQEDELVANEIAALRILRGSLAEVERLPQIEHERSQLERQRRELRATVSAQAAELEKVRKDAERYQYIRRGDKGTYNILYLAANCLDEAVDAALAQSSSQMDAPGAKG